MADKNYYPQQQGDINETEALKHIRIVNVEIGVGATVGPYYPGNARSVQVITTGTALFQARGNGSPGIADDVFRSLAMSYANIQSPTAALVGSITGNAMPHEFYIKNTQSGVVNPTTIYFNY
jgi:hypothetical protein